MQYNIIYNRIRISLQKYYLFQTLQSFFADLFYLTCFKSSMQMSKAFILTGYTAFIYVKMKA